MAKYKVPILSKFEWQAPVLDKDLSAPPGSPAKGDRYIVGSSATGDWSGHDGDIAEYNGSSWEFTTKKEGLFTFIKDEDKLYQYIASWAIFGGGGASGLGRLDIDENFNGLANGNISGKGSYTGWGTWVVNADAGCSAEVVDLGGGAKILRLARTTGSGGVETYLDWNDSDNDWGLRTGTLIKFKMRINLVNNVDARMVMKSAGNYAWAIHFDASASTVAFWSGGSSINLWNAANNTWYEVAILMTGAAGPAPYLDIFKDKSYNATKLCDATICNVNMTRLVFNFSSGSSSALQFDIDDFKVYNLMMPGG